MLTGGTTEASHYGLFVAGHCTFKSGRSGGCLDWVTNTNGVFTIVPSEEQPEDSAAGYELPCTVLRNPRRAPAQYLRSLIGQGQVAR